MSYVQCVNINIFLILLSFQIYLVGTVPLRSRWPCCIISNELLSVFFQLFSFWLWFDKSSASNRCPIWPFSSASVTGAFHHDGWEGEEGHACNVHRKSEDTLMAGMKGIPIAPQTVGTSRGQHWFILRKTRLHTLLQRSSKSESSGMLFSINRHGRSWCESRKEVVTGYLGPREVVSYLLLSISLSRFVFSKLSYQKSNWGFPGGTVVKNLPANAGDTGSSPGPGRYHMPQSN